MNAKVIVEFTSESEFKSNVRKIRNIHSISSDENIEIYAYPRQEIYNKITLSIEIRFKEKNEQMLKLSMLKKNSRIMVSSVHGEGRETYFDGVVTSKETEFNKGQYISICKMFATNHAMALRHKALSIRDGLNKLDIIDVIGSAAYDNLSNRPKMVVDIEDGIDTTLNVCYSKNTRISHMFNEFLFQNDLTCTIKPGKFGEMNTRIERLSTSRMKMIEDFKKPRHTITEDEIKYLKIKDF